MGAVARLAQLPRALFVQVLEALQVPLGLVFCMRVLWLLLGVAVFY